MITGDTGSLETEETLTSCLVIHVLYSGKNFNEIWQCNQIRNKNIMINCMFFMTKRSECDIFYFNYMYNALRLSYMYCILLFPMYAVF